MQILFAFLLSLSFTERFGRIDDVQRWTHVVTLLLSGLTTACSSGLRRPTGWPSAGG